MIWTFSGDDRTHFGCAYIYGYSEVVLHHDGLLYGAGGMEREG